jgi:hypothetical protein
VKLHYTSNSVFLMKGLIEGRFDITTTAIDNLIAYQEGQGETPVSVAPDLVAFMGLENAFLNLVALPEIKSINDLRGKDLAPVRVVAARPAAVIFSAAADANSRQRLQSGAWIPSYFSKR